MSRVNSGRLLTLRIVGSRPMVLNALDTAGRSCWGTVQTLTLSVAYTGDEPVETIQVRIINSTNPDQTTVLDLATSGLIAMRRE